MNTNRKILSSLNKSPKTNDDLQKEIGGDISVHLNHLSSTDEKMIRFDIRQNKWYITPKGELFLKTFSMKDLKFWIPIAVSVLLAITSLLGAFLIASYTSQQNRIIAASVEPDLDFYIQSLDDIPELEASRIAHLSNNSENGHQLTLCVKNKGQLQSGHVYAQLIDNWTYGGDWNFQSLLHDNYTCETQRIVASSCKSPEILGSWFSCNKSNIPNGLSELNFKIICENCGEGNKKYIEKIPVCIWHDNSSFCDKLNNKF